MLENRPEKEPDSYDSSLPALPSLPSLQSETARRKSDNSAAPLGQGATRRDNGQIPQLSGRRWHQRQLDPVVSFSTAPISY